MRVRRRDGSSGPWPVALWLYAVGAAVLGVSALAGGATLVADPSGGGLSLPLAYLEGSPFADYLLPGLVLFSAFGIGSFAVLYGVARRRPWAWVGAVGLGAAQVVWIAVQLYVIRTLHPLQAVFGGLGAALVVLALLPSVRDALQPTRQERA
ncbi:MAG: hypothetical protein ABEJ23_08740 [Haloarculaceae archaeon]